MSSVLLVTWFFLIGPGSDLQIQGWPTAKITSESA